MELAPATEYWGSARIHPDEPGITTVEDVYYVPHADNTGWGIFDHEDVIVEAAVDRGYIDQRMLSQLPTPTVSYYDVEDEAPLADYIYVGRFTPHFGHFLVEVLPRYWSITRGLRQGQKLLIHSNASSNFFAGYEHAADIFTSLGLSRDDFVWSARPMWIRSLTIPHTTFSQQCWASPDYARLCRHIGRRTLAKARPTPDERPVWLSKTRLTGGVSHFEVAQEHALEAVLAAAGVEIVYPELLSFREQVSLFSNRKTILASTSSALHVAMFAPPTARIISLSLNRVTNSNYLMMDQLRGRNIEFYHDRGSVLINDDPRFMLTARMSDPEGVARALLALI